MLTTRIHMALRPCPIAPSTARSPSDDRNTVLSIPGCVWPDHRHPCSAKPSAISGVTGTPPGTPRMISFRPPVVNIANSSPVSAVSAAKSL